MPKHAYLIIAHTDMRALENLLRSADDERNLIFLHADKKWKGFDASAVSSSVRRAELHILGERINVKWGGFSQIKTELSLMEHAVLRGGWSYCHLLSGQDICIKTQDDIHAFFDAHEGKEFLTFCGKDWNEEAQERVRYHYPEGGKSKFGSFFLKVSKKIQKLFRVDRTKGDHVQWLGGSNWASMTFAFTEFLVGHRAEILQRLRGTYCADELYKQTIAYHSRFKDSVYLLKIPQKNDDTDEDMHLANMRFIDWVRGMPYTFQTEDLAELLSSPCMFARRATSALSQTILENLQK